MIRKLLPFGWLDAPLLQLLLALFSRNALENLLMKPQGLYHRHASTKWVHTYMIQDLQDELVAKRWLVRAHRRYSVFYCSFYNLRMHSYVNHITVYLLGQVEGWSIVNTIPAVSRGQSSGVNFAYSRRIFYLYIIWLRKSVVPLFPRMAHFSGMHSQQHLTVFTLRIRRRGLFSQKPP